MATCCSVGAAANFCAGVDTGFAGAATATVSCFGAAGLCAASAFLPAANVCTTTAPRPPAAIVTIFVAYVSGFVEFAAIIDSAIRFTAS